MAEHSAVRRTSGYRDRDRRSGPSTTEDAFWPDATVNGYGVGESSAAGSLLAFTPAKERMPLEDFKEDELLASERGDGPRRSHGNAHREDRARRKQRQRGSSAFLLQDAVSKDRDAAAAHRRRVSKPATQMFTTSSRTADQPWNGSGSQSVASDPSSGPRSLATPEPGAVRDQDLSPEQQEPGSGSPRLDVDSTQIVQMALNLSESRRIASHRSLSRTNPPKLTPLPDPAQGSSLRQHLQQQRRSSRNISPKPGQSIPGRIPSIARANSPLQAALLGNTEGRYRYQFSPSTLARAQKAKEHLELMAEYRRLLEHLPQLKPGYGAPEQASPSLTQTSTSATAGGALGRPYNPLQYIRNRKVRARERKVIDGEKQGFGDVENVRAWIDKICQQAHPQKTHEGANGSSSSSALPSSPMVPFSGADQAETPTSPEPGVKNLPTRVRRPRVDWSLEPCDMIADAYWLEQGDNKYLIEDRQRRMIFPPPPNNAITDNDQAMDEQFLGSLPSTTAVSLSDMKEAGLAKVDTDLSQSSAKERAKQRLHDITGFHHRHSSSTHSHHDFLRRRRESFSDLSGSDSESRSKKVRHGRSGTITSSSNDLLQKQMLEMIAKEAQEKDLANVPETDAEHAYESVGGGTPDRPPLSSPPSRFASRKGSVADASDSDHKPFSDKPRWGVPPKYQQRPSRQSLEVPDSYRQGGSVEHAASLPGSPELKAARDVSFLPANGHDSSQPSSRAASPTRNPLSKVKQILREKGREAGMAHWQDEGPEPRERRSSFHDLTPPSKRAASPDKSSPIIDGKPFGRGFEEGHKSHRRTASLRPRMDESGVGLRGIFKPPRIDTVLRGGVSKLGDMLWKKDGSNEDPPPEADETDESDAEAQRGRRPSSTLAHVDTTRPAQDEAHGPPRHFLDAMPTFHHVANTHRMPGADDSRHARHLSRFDQMKPPRIDVRSAASSVSPSLMPQTPMVDSEVSDAESYMAGRRDAPQSTRNAQDGSGLVSKSSDELASQRQSRHWSIADQNVPAEPKQLSRREIARTRALILSSGIKAMEIGRRAYTQHKPFEDVLSGGDAASTKAHLAGIHWEEIARVSPALSEFRTRQVAFCELYPLAAQSLGISIQASGQRWQQAADRFTSKTGPDLRRRIWSVRQRVNDDLSNMTRTAADEADETIRDLALGQPLKVKHVVDTIDNMLRKRRRRFRWVRRGLWLSVEWALVGFMWYVWFVVMIFRIFWGVGRGILSGVRWLLWL